MQIIADNKRFLTVFDYLVCISIFLSSKGDINNAFKPQDTS
jgi:hypothetical protein